MGAVDAGAGDADYRVASFLDRRVGDVLDPNVAGRVHDRSAHYCFTSVTSGACAYSSSLTCSPQVTGLPVSSASCIAMCVMNRVAAAPCQWFSPGSKKTRSPGRMTSTGPPSRWQRPTPSVTKIVCPCGWVCQAVRAPGVKWTAAALSGAAAATVSMKTAPLNQSAGPRPVSMLLRVISIALTVLPPYAQISAGASNGLPPSVSKVTIARNGHLSSVSLLG